MFSQVSVILSTGGEHPPGRHPPGKNPHPWTDTLRPDTTPAQGRHPPPGRHPLGRYGNCSRRYASYWNAFLLRNLLKRVGVVIIVLTCVSWFTDTKDREVYNGCNGIYIHRCRFQFQSHSCTQQLGAESETETMHGEKFYIIQCSYLVCSLNQNRNPDLAI